METKIISNSLDLKRLHDFKNVEHETLTNQKHLEKNIAEIKGLRQQ
ncbi:hypothetical protein [Bartonella koehlerae]|nr:hypothetical protein [Bartonella koehlerae]